MHVVPLTKLAMQNLTDGELLTFRRELWNDPDRVDELRDCESILRSRGWVLTDFT